MGSASGSYCSECGRRVAVTKEGVARRHNRGPRNRDQAHPCPGSGRPTTTNTARDAARALQRPPATATVDHDAVWPRDADHRFRIYAVVGDERRVLAATPDAGGVGMALVTLHEDAKTIGRRLCDEGRIGVLDVMPGGRPSPRGEWIVTPWDRQPA